MHGLETYITDDKSLENPGATETRAPFSVQFISFSCNFRRVGYPFPAGNPGSATANVMSVSTPPKLAARVEPHLLTDHLIFTFLILK